MNAAASDEPRSWGTYRWWVTIGALFAAQAGLLIRLQDKEIPAPAKHSIFAIAHLGANVPKALEMEEDPALFALPGAIGFSGQSWQAASPITSAASDWTEPPRFLSLEPADMGALFGQVVGTNAPAKLMVADKPDPAPDTGDYIPILNLMAGRTTWRLEGALARRPVTTIPAPGQVVATNLLSDSRVELVVDEEGQVFSAALTSVRAANDAGQAAADLAALATARKIEFGPAGKKAGVSFETGELVVHWAPPADH